MRRYYYPEDVIKVDGQAELGYYFGLSLEGDVSFKSRLPVCLTSEELQRLDDLYFRIWEDARIRGRKANAEVFLREHYPRVVKERESYEEFVCMTGTHSVVSFRKYLLESGEGL